MFATAAEDVRVWSSASLQLCCQFDVSKAPKVSSVSWSADGKQLASVARNQDIIQLTAFGDGQPRHTKVHVEGACMCSQFSHLDSDYLGLGLYDGTVQLLKSGKAVFSYRPHKETTCVAFSSNDSFVASGASDGSVALLRTETKRAQSLGEPTGKAVMGLQWSLHHRFRLLSCSADGQLSVWDASAQRLQGRHCLHPGRLATALSLSPVNEALVVTVGLDSRLVLFDMATASEQASVATPESLESVAFLPDGQRVVAGATSGRVYLYDLRNTRQTPPSVLGMHTAPVTAIATMQSMQVEAQMAVLVRASGGSMQAAASSTSKQLPVRFRLGSANLQPLLSPVDDVDASGSHSSVFSEEPCEVKGLHDASWASVDSNARAHRQFRLSDFMPVLADSPSPLSLGTTFRSSPRTSLGEENLRVAAGTTGAVETPQVNGTGAAQSHHSVRVELAAEEASQHQSLCNGCPTGAAEPHLPEPLLHRLDDMVTERARQLDAHLRHIHIQMTLMQRTFMGEVQSMLQQVFDEVLALRADIRELRGDI